MLSHTKFQFNWTLTKSFSSMSSEISPELVTLVLGNNLWNIGKKLLQVCPKTLSRRKKNKGNWKAFCVTPKQNNYSCTKNLWSRQDSVCWVQPLTSLSKDQLIKVSLISYIWMSNLSSIANAGNEGNEGNRPVP